MRQTGGLLGRKAPNISMLVMRQKQVVGAMTAICRFISEHGVGVVASTETTVTVCGFWAQGKRFGWRVETLPAEWTAVREWLGY